MRPLLAAAAVVLAVAGCGLLPPSQTAPEAPLTARETSGPAEPSKQPAEPALTKAEAAYLAVFDGPRAKYLDADGTLDEETYLEDGREACELAAYEDQVTMVQEVLEPVEGETDIYRAALTKLCPKHRKVWTLAAGGFADGEYTVGKRIKPGTYRTLRRPVSDCYWERSTGTGRIIANQLVTNAPQGLRVTLARGEGFTSRDCGPWVRA